LPLSAVPGTHGLANDPVLKYSLAWSPGPVSIAL